MYRVTLYEFELSTEYDDYLGWLGRAIWDARALTVNTTATESLSSCENARARSGTLVRGSQYWETTRQG